MGFGYQSSCSFCPGLLFVSCQNRGSSHRVVWNGSMMTYLIRGSSSSSSSRNACAARLRRPPPALAPGRRCDGPPALPLDPICSITLAGASAWVPRVSRGPPLGPAESAAHSSGCLRLGAPLCYNSLKLSASCELSFLCTTSSWPTRATPTARFQAQARKRKRNRLPGRDRRLRRQVSPRAQQKRQQRPGPPARNRACQPKPVNGRRPMC